MPYYPPISAGVWQDLTLLNSWVNFGDPVAPIGCCVDSLQTVWMRGLGVGTIATDSVICVLPIEFRPAYRKVFAVVTGLLGYGDSFGRIDVSADGSVILLSGQAGFVSLDNVAFKAGS
uniref:Uncharacterized protein n=1 Tax=Oscillatoriales cyanobacterium SpSt-402 TaxID=2282168 RepID=A0A832M3H6_9CYAN